MFNINKNVSAFDMHCGRVGGRILRNLSRSSVRIELPHNKNLRKSSKKKMYAKISKKHKKKNFSCNLVRNIVNNK